MQCMLSLANFGAVDDEGSSAGTGPTGAGIAGRTGRRSTPTTTTNILLGRLITSVGLTHGPNPNTNTDRVFHLPAPAHKSLTHVLALIILPTLTLISS